MKVQIEKGNKKVQREYGKKSMWPDKNEKSHS